jgi:hypothetical protein
VLLRLDESNGDKIGWRRARISEDQFAKVETPHIKMVEVSLRMHTFPQNTADHDPLGLES